MASILGSIEAGGTKFVCAVGNADGVMSDVRIPTTTPGETLQGVVGFFKDWSGQPIEAVGIATFGPAGVNRDRDDFGYITTTPKPGWQNTDLAGEIKRALGVPIGFDTDVNGAALAELRWGAAKNRENCLYITVGTGIGGGFALGDQCLHGMIHPEMGHIRVPRSPEDRVAYAGHCPFHGDCLEGLACGPALADRWGQPAEALPSSHPAWDLLGGHLGFAVTNFLLTLSPEKIVLGGGVMHQSGLLERIRENVRTALNGYIQSPEVAEKIENYIVSPGLGEKSGIFGGFALAESVLG